MENDFLLVMLGVVGGLVLLGVLFLVIIYKAWKIRRRWRAYYKSDRWKVKRQEAFAVHGRKCAICGTDKNLQVHHLLYWKWGFPIQGRENPKRDLRILCGDHHPKGFYSRWRIRFDRWIYSMKHAKVIKND